MIPLLELVGRDWYLWNPTHSSLKCMFKVDELFSDYFPAFLLLTEDACMACRAHACPWVQVVWMRELGLHDLCASCRFGHVCNQWVMLLLGAGQLWLIALVQALSTELRWTFVVGGDWLPPPKLAGVSSEVKAALTAWPSSLAPQTQPKFTNHTSLHMPVI